MKYYAVGMVIALTILRIFKEISTDTLCIGSVLCVLLDVTATGFQALMEIK
jgi:hypothetical protein